jgi:hypothetical protein
LNKETDYRKTLKDDESLAIFLRGMAKFDHYFCDAMAQGEDFTIRLEVTGNKGNLLHCRASADGFERPPGVEREINPPSCPSGKLRRSR